MGNTELELMDKAGKDLETLCNDYIRNSDETFEFNVSYGGLRRPIDSQDYSIIIEVDYSGTIDKRQVATVVPGAHNFQGKNYSVHCAYNNSASISWGDDGC